MKYFPQLHVHTMYSLLDGLSKPREWIDFCIQHGVNSMAITDHGNCHGLMDFYSSAKAASKENNTNFIPILGCEFYFVNDLKDKEEKHSHILVLAKNLIGYNNLLKLSSLSYDSDHFYKKSRITCADLDTHKDGIILSTACVGSPVNVLIGAGKLQEAFALLSKFKDMFGEDFYAEFQFLNLDKRWNSITKQFENTANFQCQINEHLYDMAKSLNIKCIVTNDCHYLNKEDKILQDIVIANSFAGKDGWKFAHDHYYYKSHEEIEQIMLEHHPKFNVAMLNEMVNNCYEVVEKCSQLDIPIGKINLPQFDYMSNKLAMPGDNAKSLIMRIIQSNAHLTPANQELRYAKQLKHELDIFEKHNLLDYFLIISDMLEFCRTNDIPYGPSRGSVGGSILAYFLGITKIDAIQSGCFFERFITEERLNAGHPPDIDLDFGDDERERVKDYLYAKYGSDHVAPICTFGSMRIKSAIRDVTRIENPKLVFDIDIKLTSAENQEDIRKRQLGQMTLLEERQIQKEISIICSKFDITPPDVSEEDYFWQVVEMDEELQKWLAANISIKDKVIKLLGNARQVGVHASALAICRDPLKSVLPTCTHGRQQSNERIAVTQYNGSMAEMAGVIKIDILGLKTLTIIKNTTELINKKYGTNLHWSSLPSDDPAARHMLQNGWTETAFQYGTPSFFRLLKDVGDVISNKGQTIQDNEFGSMMVALNRPGPLQQGMDKQLMANIENPDRITYLHPLLKPILSTTHGILIYQEQVMDICRSIGGFSLAEAEETRRAMGKKKKEIIAQLLTHKDKFLKYATTELRPIMTMDNANTLWNYVYSFSGYGFNRAHACGYDMLAMQTLYLIAHYPVEWFVSVLNKANPEKIEEIYSYILDPKFNKRYRDLNKIFRLGVPDNLNFILPNINKSADTFTSVDNTLVMPLTVIKHLGAAAAIKISKNQPYVSLIDFIERSKSNIRVITNLILAGSFLSVEPTKTTAELLTEAYKLKEAELPDNYQHLDRFKELELKNEILSFDTINYIKIFKDLFHPYTQGLDLSRYNVGMSIIVGGKIIRKKQIKTKTGKDMGFIVLSNDNKTLDITVFPEQYDTYFNSVRNGAIVEVHGKVNFFKSRNVVLDSIRLLNKD